MDLSSNNNHAEWRVECSSYPSAHDERSDTDEFHLAETETHHRILGFLATHPNSSLLAIVQHLWPNFRDLSADERARVWFGVEKQLLAMEKLGLLQCKKCETDILLWSIKAE